MQPKDNLSHIPAARGLPEMPASPPPSSIVRVECDEPVNSNMDPLAQERLEEMMARPRGVYRVVGRWVLIGRRPASKRCCPWFFVSFMLSTGADSEAIFTSRRTITCWRPATESVCPTMKHNQTMTTEPHDWFRGNSSAPTFDFNDDGEDEGVGNN